MDYWLINFVFFCWKSIADTFLTMTMNVQMCRSGKWLFRTWLVYERVKEFWVRIESQGVITASWGHFTMIMFKYNKGRFMKISRHCWFRVKSANCDAMWNWRPFVIICNIYSYTCLKFWQTDMIRTRMPIWFRWVYPITSIPVSFVGTWLGDWICVTEVTIASSSQYKTTIWS